ncbi:MAG: DUF1732 domain-containing protein, partial [Bacteroidales bacterium]|nr:DUF1732 domain-containing protein [Bacteroidales bacterium]
MIQSMTGYGKFSAMFGEKKIIAEIKSLNSKTLDLSTRVVPLYKEKEMEIRSLIAAQLERGKVEFSLWFERDAAVESTPINAELISSYYQQLQRIEKSCGIPVSPITLMPALLRMPDVLNKTEVAELTDEEWSVAQNVVQEAILRLIEFRMQEGAALERKFREKIDNIERLLHAIEPYEKERVAKIRERITSALEKEVGIEYDKNRLEQELIYYIEKLDINEEKQRLANHLDYFRETLAN